MILILLKHNSNSFDTLNEHIFICNKREMIASKKENKLNIKSVYIFVNTIIIEYMFIVDAFYCESLQWMTRLSHLHELCFIYNCGVDELADRWRSRYELFFLSQWALDKSRSNETRIYCRVIVAILFNDFHVRNIEYCELQIWEYEDE